MAAPAETFNTYVAVGNREDLTDAIYNIAPTDTPMTSSIARVKASAVKHEWQIDELAAATHQGYIEGDDATGDTREPTVRLDNQTQIFRKVVVVSRTQRVVQSAGRRDEYAYQLARRGKELKRNIEFSMLGFHAKAAGDTANARISGGLINYLYTTTVGNFGSVTVTFVGNGTTIDVGNNQGGSVGVLKAKLDTVISQLWVEGSDANVIMCGRLDKTTLSSMSGIATLYREVPKGYQGGGSMSEYCILVVVPNRFMPARAIYLLDYEYLAVAELDPIDVVPLSKTGDSDRAMIICEATLEVRNPRAHGAIVNWTLSA